MPGRRRRPRAALVGVRAAPTAWRSGSPPARRPSTTPCGRWSATSRDGFTYSERPPDHEYPLEAFLFEDKIGYCQQFSGAMALMLRMSGIPARVVSGFSPGSLNRDSGEYRVRDLDAHSWVEVYFNDIGWVTFDPTPAGRAGRSRRARDQQPAG